MSFKNTKKQGDWGVGIAIGFFAERGVTVCVPLTDSQDYDLVIETESGLKKVQVKTTTYKRYGKYCVSLTTKGGNRTGTTIKKFNPLSVDFVFIVTGNGEKYLIPAALLRNAITLNDKFEPFKCKL